MRQWWALVLGLLAWSVGGCVTPPPVQTTAWLDHLRPFRGAAASDVVQMDVALIERPVGDAYINKELWTAADEQVIALERKAALEDNGFRIGQIGGIPPAGLQELLTSGRSCVDPHRIQMHADTPRTLTLGATLPVCRFDLHQDGRRIPVTWKQAQCTVQVVPSLASDGRTRLHFMPQIQHGQRMLLPRPAADRSGWIRQEQRPTEDYPDLSWDVTLAPNEYVVVGTRFDRPETLGQQCFLPGAGEAPVQRLLVIRTGRAAAGLEAEGDESSVRSPALAAQAAWSSVP